jgi:hypothetical protein
MTPDSHHDVETRLRDAFGAVRTQVGAPPAPEPRVEERRRGPWLLAAAAVVLVALLVAVGVAQRDDEVVVTASPTIAPAEFDTAAAAACRRLEAGINGVGPRFATVEAYEVARAQAAGPLADAVAAFTALRSPADDPDVRAVTVARLRTAELGLDGAVDAATAGRFDRAAQAWLDVEQAVADAAGALVDRGVLACLALT